MQNWNSFQIKIKFGVLSLKIWRFWARASRMSHIQVPGSCTKDHEKNAKNYGHFAKIVILNFKNWEIFKNYRNFNTVWEKWNFFLLVIFIGDFESELRIWKIFEINPWAPSWSFLALWRRFIRSLSNSTKIWRAICSKNHGTKFSEIFIVELKESDESSSKCINFTNLRPQIKLQNLW